MRLEEHQQHLDRFYRLLNRLSDCLGGPRLLADCTKRTGWPERGIYFFFESGEVRRSNGAPRVVRVGTHALKRGAKSTLWQRLRNHRGYVGGPNPGSGNHNLSVFRHHVGAAVLNSRGDRELLARWLSGSRNGSLRCVEVEVSDHIRRMPFLWFEVPDEPGPESNRGYVERNSIGLLTHGFPVEAADPPSSIWLGLHSVNNTVRSCGMWNVDHVGGGYKPEFLDLLEQSIADMCKGGASS